MNHRSGIRAQQLGLASESELWASRDEPAVRSELASRFLPFAKSIAIRYRGKAESLDDLLQIASLGLMNAINRYDAGRGMPFIAFASPTINGELKRHFRDRVSAIHIPRGVYERIGRMESVERDLAGNRSQVQSIGQVAKAMDSTVEQVLEAREAVRIRHTIGFNSGEEDDGGPSEEILGEVDAEYDRVENRILASDFLRRLSRGDREIVVLRFRDELTQSQIAKRIGCSQMQVSRKLRQIMDSLSASVAGETAPAGV